MSDLFIIDDGPMPRKIATGHIETYKLTTGGIQMTTTIRIEAHCAAEKEVQVTLFTPSQLIEAFALQDGEKAERLVYDDRVINVTEAVK